MSKDKITSLSERRRQNKNKKTPEDECLYLLGRVTEELQDLLDKTEDTESTVKQLIKTVQTLAFRLKEVETKLAKEQEGLSSSEDS